MSFDAGAAQSRDLDVAVGNAGANRAGEVRDHDRALIREQINVARSRNSDLKIDRSLSCHLDFDLSLSVLRGVDLRGVFVIPGADYYSGGIGARRHLDGPRLIHHL